MKKNRKWMVVALLGAGTLVAACGARHASHRARTPEKIEEHVSKRVEHVLDDIDATDQQRAKVNQVTERVFSQFRSAHQGSKKTRSVALAEWRAGQPNAKALHDLVEQRSDEYEKTMHALVDAMIEVHGTLSPKQREEIAVMVEERFEN
jgi:Spy/CpxP family protein refolding chaperone